MFIERLLSLAAPHECLACGLEGSLLCEMCADDVLEPVPERCYRCLAISRDSAVCTKCRPRSPLMHVWVATDYDGIAKRLIRLMKYERAKAGSLPIGRQITGSLPYLPTDTVVTHLPTATTRQRIRGYDQSALIAKTVARRTTLAYSPLLGRFGQTRQVGSTRKQRFDQAEGLFFVSRPLACLGKDVIIIDDILTTGASLESAAKVLKVAGAKKVYAAVFAQKH